MHSNDSKQLDIIFDEAQRIIVEAAGWAKPKMISKLHIFFLQIGYNQLKYYLILLISI